MEKPREIFTVLDLNQVFYVTLAMHFGEISRVGNCRVLKRENLRLSLKSMKKGEIYIEDIKVAPTDQQRQGQGSRALEILHRIADSFAITLTLSGEPDNNTRVNVQRFYEKRGYIQPSPLSKHMVRVPQR